MKIKKNYQGTLFKTVIGNTLYMYIMTFMNNYRGGSRYSVSKTVILLRGKAVYLYIDPDNILHKQELIPRKPINIKKEVPHLFYFSENSYFLEFFSKDHTKEPHPQFQVIKKSSLN